MADKSKDAPRYGVFTDRDFKDIHVREDKIRVCTTHDGEVWYNPDKSEKYFTGLNAAKMSQKVIQYWEDVRAGKRTREDARIGSLNARRRRKAHRQRFEYDPRKVPKELRFDAYMIPKTAGPVFDYIRRNMKKFGVGTFDHPENTKTSRELVANEMRDIYRDILQINRELYGDAWPVLIRSMGMSHDVIQYLEDPSEYIKTRKSGKLKSFASAEFAAALRQMCLVNLVHVYNIMETLRETEREIWVALQRTHDVRVVPGRFKVPLRPDTDDPKAIKAWEERHKKAGTWATSMRDVVGEEGFYETLLMPLRARALVNYPELDIQDALAAEREKIMPDYYSPLTRGTGTAELAYWQKRDDVLSEAMQLERDRIKAIAEEDPGFGVEEAEKWWNDASKIWSNWRRSVTGNTTRKDGKRRKPSHPQDVKRLRNHLWSDILDYIETLRFERKRQRRAHAEDGEDVPHSRD